MIVDDPNEPTSYANEIQCREYLLKAIQRAEDEMMIGAFPSDPIQFKTRYDETDRTMMVAMEVSVREMMARHKYDIMQDMISRMTQALAAQIASDMRHQLYSELQPLIEAELKAAIRDEVKKQVKHAVEGRLDEFLEEALG